MMSKVCEIFAKFEKAPTSENSQGLFSKLSEISPSMQEQEGIYHFWKSYNNSSTGLWFVTEIPKQAK